MHWPLLICIRLYHYCISPMLPIACRFAPTCSQYAQEAFVTHGIVRGGILTWRRLMRCHPFGGQGFDPVPSSYHCDVTCRHE